MKRNMNFRLRLSNFVEKLRRINQAFDRKFSGPFSEKDYHELARVVCEIAETGIGAEACLQRGCLPMKINYYSPVPDIADLEQRRVWDRRSELSGIDFLPNQQLALLARLGREFGDECKWPRTPTSDPLQFYTDNNSFSFGCAASLHCILRYFKPSRLIEVGSGNSSLVISSALVQNARNHSHQKCEYTIIDPYPGENIEGGLPGLNRLIKERVELLDTNKFDQLEKNDILFIDSSHTVRTGGDVNYLILDVLPRLAPGVIVHFHDISLPYEYSRIYFTNPSFRVFWAEAYLLQAFLSLNSRFEILLAMNYLMKDEPKHFSSAFPHFDPAKNWADSGSFWIRSK